MRKVLLAVVMIIGLFLMTGCKDKDPEVIIDDIDFSEIYPNTGTYYEVFVRSFSDSDNDGVGDFNGITEKLDYLKDLGINALWLMPIHPSPTYHGYDVTDYYDVNPDYGTMEDFENLLAAAEEQGIDIIIDFVLNHSSNQNPWFQGWKDGDPAYNGFYRLITSGDVRLNQTGAWGQNIWHNTTGGYYCGYFGGGMPDLNWSNPAVQDEMVNVAKFWIEKGVDGFRLDAAIHLEGVGEVKSPTIPIDSTLIKLELFEYQIESEYPDIYIIGEVWDSFSISSLFYKAMDSTFNFEVGDEIIDTINRGYSSDYINDIIRYNEIIAEYGSDGIDAPFLKNHDQDRLASIFNGYMPKLKLAAEMLLTLPGNPFIYYGEELGMFGIKSTGPYWDETRRSPFLFEEDYKTSWFPDDLNNNVLNVNEQLADEDSLIYVYKNILEVRNDSLALKYGDIFAYEEESSVLLGYYRVFNYDENNQEIVLVLHNVSDGDYQLYFDEVDIMYYSKGIDNFDGSISGRSTLILRMSNDMMGNFYGEE